MNTTIIVLITVILVLISGFLIGWWIARRKIKKLTKNIDKQLEQPNVIDEYIKQKNLQSLSTTEKEVDENDRRRKFGGDGGQFYAGGYIEREPIVKTAIGEPQSQGSPEGRSDLPIRSPGETGEVDRSEQPEPGNNEEDWADFS